LFRFDCEAFYRHGMDGDGLLLLVLAACLPGLTARLEESRLAMMRAFGICAFVGLLAGCSGGGYLPYAPHSLDPMTLNSLVAEASQADGVPPGLVRAVVMAESGGNPSAVSIAGAQGLMQLMPGTSAGCGIADPFDATQNVSCGTGYLRSLLNRYHGNVMLAVAAYNAGPGAVDRYHGVPPYAETQAYVVRVLNAYRNY
jgi:soluble lytic murein transglycosylase-like protein